MNLVDLVGNTPLVKIENMSPNENVEIYAKLESFNPSGSVKDRAVKFMIEDAERRGVLKKGMTIVEASSGNTGIGLAMISCLKGYNVVITMSESMSMERRKILQSYGAKIVLTPAEKNTDGAIEKAHLLAEKNGYFMPNQFDNNANVMAHYETTGEEILREIYPTHLIAGVGTGGTIMGTGMRLREANPDIKIIGLQPHKETPIQGLKNMEISRIPGIFDESFLDETRYIRLEDAVDMVRKLGKQGYSVGLSSGAAMSGALDLAKELEEGIIVTIFPDGAEKYLSTGLYETEVELQRVIRENQRTTLKSQQISR